MGGRLGNGLKLCEDMICTPVCHEACGVRLWAVVKTVMNVALCPSATLSIMNATCTDPGANRPDLWRRRGVGRPAGDLRAVRRSVATALNRFN